MASSFTYCFAPSGGGDGVRYGVATICTNHPIHSYRSDKVIQVVPPSGVIANYYSVPDSRFIAVPSGWNDLN